MRNPQDAEDLLQEVFLRIHRKSEALKQVDRLPAWLFQITRNALIDHYRRAAARHRNTDEAANVGVLERPALNAAD